MIQILGADYYWIYCRKGYPRLGLGCLVPRSWRLGIELALGLGIKGVEEGLRKGSWGISFVSVRVRVRVRGEEVQRELKESEEEMERECV